MQLSNDIEVLRLLSFTNSIVDANNMSLIGLLLRGLGRSRSQVFGCVGCYKPNKRLYHS